MREHDEMPARPVRGRFTTDPPPDWHPADDETEPAPESEAELRGTLLDVTAAQYYSETWPGVGSDPLLNPSTAKTLLQHSAERAHHEHPRLGGNCREATRAMDDGTVIHALLLGKGLERVAEVEADSFQTKWAKAERDAARAEGRTPIVTRRLDELREAAEQIRKKLASLGVVFDGESEVACTWTEESEHGIVPCRTMFDHLKVERGRIIDLKKIDSATQRSIEFHVDDYGWDIQAAAHKRALAIAEPDLAGRITYEWVIVELAPPYAVQIAEPDGLVLEIGTRRWRRAVQRWARCRRDGVWPGPNDGKRLRVSPTVRAAKEEGLHP